MAYIALSKRNYFHNLQCLCDKLGSKERLAVVLKDNAYGHGLLEMAELSREFGIAKAIVRNYHEAMKIKEYFPFIMILAPDMGKVGIEFSLTINSLEALSLAPKGAKIHLKIDSGMHRNGIMIDEIEEAFVMIENRGLILEGVMTHFRDADALSTGLFWQMKNWEEIKEKTLTLCEKFALQTPLFHAANSATLLRLENYHDDFARCGIATYGYGDVLLKPVLALWAEKMASRYLKKGQRVGYGGVGACYHDGVVSTYDVGYGDGYFRYDGEGDLSTPDGLKIIGRVSMDNIAIEGDAKKVLLFEDATALAVYHDTIVYDILVKLSTSLKRLIIR